MRELLDLTHNALSAGNLGRAGQYLDELCARSRELPGAGEELGSAESYGVPAHVRQFFQDRIDWVNGCIRKEAA
jgi:hypothetical protein